MPEYLHPGVYVEETSYRGKPIQGVATSTAGFVGAASAGPEGTPRLVTSLNGFRQTYGEPISPPNGLGDYLGHAVKAFFENGGSRAYIVRALAGDAKASTAAIEQGIVLSLASGVTVRGETREIPLNSLRGVQNNSMLRVFTRKDSLSAFSEKRQMTVESYDTARNRVTVVAGDALPTGETLEPDHTYFLIDGTAPHGVGGSGNGPTFTARNRGVDGDRISVLVTPTDLAPVRLRTGSTSRAKPELEAVAGPIADGEQNLTLSSAALQRLRVGDTISVGTSQDRIVASIDDGEIDFGIVAGGDIADYTGGEVTLSLAQRGGTALPTPIRLGSIAAGAFDLTVAPTTQAGVPHDVVATLEVGDRLHLENAGGDEDHLDITAVRLRPDVGPGPNVHLQAATPVTPAQTGATVSVRLLTTSSSDADHARLVVDSTDGFTAPFRAGTLEPISITDGSNYVGSTIELVDPSTKTIFVSKANPAAAGEFASGVTETSWVGVESLQAAASGATVLPVASTGSFYTGAKIEIDTGTSKIENVVSAVDPGKRTITVATALAANLEVPPDPAVREVYVRTAEIEIKVLVDGAVKESLSGLSWNDDAALDSFLRYYVERINDGETGSKLVEVTPKTGAGSGFADQPTTANGRPTSLGSGSNGSALTALDLIGTDNGPGARTGIEALAERNDIAIVAVPGVHDENVQGALISHCERLRYRMAVLDGPQGNRMVGDIQKHRNNYDSKYAAYYAPWVKTLDLRTGRDILLPPSGYVVGIYARSDSTRGVHKAPANEVVRNITDVEFPFGNGEQDVLNPGGVNLIRDLTPNGIRVWGARTITSDQEWKYVNVRRLFIYVEHSIDLGTQWVVFEPNNESLWARVVETITAFLTGVWKTGALIGVTPEEAFFVRCDRTTMTQDDLDNGRLVCEIGLAPTYPAEFVIFRIGQFTASAS